MNALLGELDPKAIGAKPEEFIDKWLVREMDQSGIVKSLLAAKGSIIKVQNSPQRARSLGKFGKKSFFVSLWFESCVARGNFLSPERLGIRYSSRKERQGRKVGKLFSLFHCVLCVVGARYCEFRLRLCRARSGVIYLRIRSKKLLSSNLRMLRFPIRSSIFTTSPIRGFCVYSRRWTLRMPSMVGQGLRAMVIIVSW